MNIKKSAEKVKIGYFEPFSRSLAGKSKVDRFSVKSVRLATLFTGSFLICLRAVYSPISQDQMRAHQSKHRAGEAWWSDCV